jgi:hypothetical protein
MSPQLRKGAVLWNKDDLGMSQRYDASAQAAQELGVLPLGVREPDDFNEASASMDRGSPDAILMVTDSVTLINRKRVFDYAAQHRLKAIYEQDFMDRDGGLMSYGAEAQESFDRARRCANRPHFSRHGAPDLPFEMPTRYRRRHHHRLSAADSAIEVLCTSTPWLPPAPPTSPSPPTAPSFAPNQNSQKRNVDVGQQPQRHPAGRCRSVCVGACWNRRRLARAREGREHDQRRPHCRCCRIWRSLLLMTPYLAALDRRRHHRRRPTRRSPRQHRRPSSIVAPESANNNSAKKKCRRRPAAAAPPSRPVQVGLRRSLLESAPPCACA